MNNLNNDNFGQEYAQGETINSKETDLEVIFLTRYAYYCTWHKTFTD